jgi:ATP-dependent exoDNAse (exonuclease V) alpha subunit
VREQLTLAYAVTVHAAQGQDVDTTHPVITAQTSRTALYVELSRGRDADTAHIATLTGANDPAQGRDVSMARLPHRDLDRRTRARGSR